MHPRFTEKLAKMYVDKLTTKGNETAKSWAESFLRGPDLLEVADGVWKLLKKRGFKVPDDKA